MHSVHAMHLGGQFSCSKLDTRFVSVVLISYTSVIELLGQCQPASS